MRGESGAMQGDTGVLCKPTSKALSCRGRSALRHSISNLEVRRLFLGLLRTEQFAAGLLRTAMRVARLGVFAGEFINVRLGFAR